MAGGFVKAEYYPGDGSAPRIIRIQPETRTLAFVGHSNGDTGASTFYRVVTVVSGGSRRSAKSFARLVKFQLTNGVPDGYKGNAILVLPWLYPQGFSDLTVGVKGTYLGFEATVMSRKDERMLPL